MSIHGLVADCADALKSIDSELPRHKEFGPGIGPFGEPQLVKLLADRLNKMETYRGLVRTMRTPDLKIQGRWNVEFKIIRPYGDNGREAENWSVNLLHPYAGNSSLLGDCIKLSAMESSERKAVVAIGYEHDPVQTPLEPLVRAFELIADQVLGISLSERAEARRSNLVHAIHRQVILFGWEIK